MKEKKTLSEKKKIKNDVRKLIKEKDSELNQNKVACKRKRKELKRNCDSDNKEIIKYKQKLKSKLSNANK